MSSDTLVKAPAAPDIPEGADSLRIVTSLLGVRPYHVERYHARGPEAAR